MAKKMEIRAVSYVHVGNQLVRFDELSPHMRQQAAKALQLRYFNELFRGKAVFYYNNEEDHTNEEASDKQGCAEGSGDE